MQYIWISQSGSLIKLCEQDNNLCEQNNKLCGQDTQFFEQDIKLSKQDIKLSGQDIKLSKQDTIFIGQLKKIKLACPFPGSIYLSKTQGYVINT